MKNKNESSLGKVLIGLAGVGASIFAAKKIIDLYAEEEDDIISKEDYQRQLLDSGCDRDGYVNYFNYGLVTLDGNADLLFEEFLKKVNEICEMPSKVFAIGDIEKLVPFEESGIESKSNYGYSIMSMLGNQAGRDYVIFLGNSNLSNIFTKQSNNPDRNNFYWREFKDQRFIINPKYVKQQFK